jgi:hypothetical protein
MGEMMRHTILFAVVSLGLAPAAFGQCVTWAPLTNLSHDAGHYAVDGNLAVDSSGSVHLVYQSFLDTWGAAYYMTNPSGSWSSPASIGSLGGKGSTPKILITPDNQLHAFYGKGSLYWRTKPVAGGSWSSPVRLDADLSGGSFIEAVTLDSAGGIYLLFGHLFDDDAPVRNGIYGKYKPLGGAWAATEVVYGNSDDGNWPRGTDIAARGTTLWAGIEVDHDVYFKKKPSSGAWPAGKGTLLVNDAGALRFAFSPVTAESSALYQQDLGCGDSCEGSPWYEVYVKYSQDDGASWSAPFNISDMTDDIDRTPSAVYDANGGLHVVWEGFCCDHKLRMRYRGRNQGTWDPAITELTSHVGGQIPGSIQSQGTNLYLVFSDSNSGIGLYDVVYTSSAASQPKLSVSPLQLNRSIMVGAMLPSDTLNIRNACVGTLNYAISDNAWWLSLSPSDGSATTETDPITIAYPGASVLTAGTYDALLTVSSNGMSSPQTVPVRLMVRTVRPDLDGDGDVDQNDFGRLQACFSGAFVPQDRPECQAMKLDGDDDVDADDVAMFMGCLSGADVNADPVCAPLYP